MTALIVIAIAAAWMASGCASCIYWWTKDYDFTNEEVPLAVICSLAGPFSFAIGWCFHGDHRVPENRVLIRKQGRKWL